MNRSKKIDKSLALYSPAKVRKLGFRKKKNVTTLKGSLKVVSDLMFHVVILERKVSLRNPYCSASKMEHYKVSFGGRKVITLKRYPELSIKSPEYQIELIKIRKGKIIQFKALKKAIYERPDGSKWHRHHEITDISRVYLFDSPAVRFLQDLKYKIPIATFEPLYRTPAPKKKRSDR